MREKPFYQKSFSRIFLGTQEYTNKVKYFLYARKNNTNKVPCFLAMQEQHKRSEVFSFLLQDEFFRQQKHHLL